MTAEPEPRVIVSLVTRRHKYVGHPQDRPMDAAAVKFADDFGADVDMDDVDDLELGEEQHGACAAFVLKHDPHVRPWETSCSWNPVAE